MVSGTLVYVQQILEVNLRLCRKTKRGAIVGRHSPPQKSQQRVDVPCMRAKWILQLGPPERLE